MKIWDENHVELDIGDVERCIKEWFKVEDDSGELTKEFYEKEWGGSNMEYEVPFELWFPTGAVKEFLKKKGLNPLGTTDRYDL